MKNLLLKGIILIILTSMLLTMFSACGDRKKTITIYSSAEDFRNATALELLEKQFPEYKIVLQYDTTGNIAAKLLTEGKNTDMDIIFELESTYLEKGKESLATLDNVDFSKYCDELVPASHKYVPLIRSSGAIIVDEAALTAKNLPVPQSYDDLLDPKYKGLISMPSPKSSGTGYIFLLSMVNERGEEAAFKYFEELSKNISRQGFTSSGSGPVQALKTGEAAIALGLTLQAVNEINNGTDYKINYFTEGAPYTVYSSAVIDGKQTDEDVMKVFDFILSTVSPNDKKLYACEKIYKDTDYTIKNYPSPISYADMEHVTDIATKDRLLDKWDY